MLVFSKVTPQHYDRQYPFIHLDEGRQLMWNKASFLRKQHNSRDNLRLGVNHRTPDQKSNVLTTRPPHLQVTLVNEQHCFVKFKILRQRFYLKNTKMVHRLLNYKIMQF